MLNRAAAESARNPKTETVDCDFVVVGGGLAGTCAAITAARRGLKVALVQDRPVLGGNASSEVRLWILGATTHMGSNNRFAREAGVVDEVVVENLYRNPDGNPLIFDTILLEMVANEPNITLLLNTSAFEVAKHPEDADRIASVKAFCSQNSTMYVLKAPLFLDSSGDGIVGFLAGAAFRMGAESKEEFDEAFAPSGEFGFLLGHSIYFYTKDVGHPVKFIPPSFALKNIPEVIPRYKAFNAKDHGCKYWWIEYGGRLDTVHDSEKIKWELWRVVYGVWDYIKNSGNFPDAANLTLEWVGHIPGKRESRRFEGDYMLTQKDVIEQRMHADAVAFGGWSIDLHPADGVYSSFPGALHLRSKGPYQIPYRCYYSRNVKNLFIAGRIISASHVAFGTIRVMATGAVGGQAIAVAASLCKKFNCLPRDINQPERMKLLQRMLYRIGHDVKHLPIADPADLATKAAVTATSSYSLQTLAPDGPPLSLANVPNGQWFPLEQGPLPEIGIVVDATADTELTAELRTTSKLEHHTPDVLLGRVTVPVKTGTGVPVILKFDGKLDQSRYAFLCFPKTPGVSIRTTRTRPTGMLVTQLRQPHVGKQFGAEDFDIWRAVRRPEAHNFAIFLSRPVNLFGAANLTNGSFRPNHLPNAWVASAADKTPAVTLTWKEPQTVARIDLFFDVDYDHALESVLQGHPESTLPFCVKQYRVLDGDGKLLHECKENHHGMNAIVLPAAVRTSSIKIEILEMNGPCPAAMFAVRCYATANPES